MVAAIFFALLLAASALYAILTLLLVGGINYTGVTLNFGASICHTYLFFGWRIEKLEAVGEERPQLAGVIRQAFEKHQGFLRKLPESSVIAVVHDFLAEKLPYPLYQVQVGGIRRQKPQFDAALTGS